MTDYDRIARAIAYISGHYHRQPTLEEVARAVSLSPFHFQRLFTEWSGVSPKKFLQYVSLQHAKPVLRRRASLAEAAFETGLSGTGRLHDLFVTIEGMTPGEYKEGGKELTISYSYAATPFGRILAASTSKGICYVAFADGERDALAGLRRQFPNARFRKATTPLQQQVGKVFHGDWTSMQTIRLHLKGTPFQLKVWEALLKIPLGRTSSYAEIAGMVRLPQGARAVGSAVARNPVAFLIPCHRVIRATGVVGDYQWGTIRKTAMLGWEAARTYGMGDSAPVGAAQS